MDRLHFSKKGKFISKRRATANKLLKHRSSHESRRLRLREADVEEANGGGGELYQLLEVEIEGDIAGETDFTVTKSETELESPAEAINDNLILGSVNHDHCYNSTTASTCNTDSDTVSVIEPEAAEPEMTGKHTFRPSI